MADEQDNGVEAAPSLSFPTNPDLFDQDDRISFSKLDGKYIAVQDDGTELEFDAQLRRWIPTVDEDEFAAHQRTYGGGDDDDDNYKADGGGAANGSNQQRNSQKRKRQKEEAAQARKRQQQQQAPRQNTAIYVTGLPPDATADEVHEVFSRKCGVVAEEIDSGRPRIKLYTDADGRFKGDALVVFFKPQSVDMAIMLLDDTEFRYAADGTASGRMRVQAADASYKKTQHDAAVESEGGAKGGGGAPAGNGGPASSSANKNNHGGGGGGDDDNTHHRPRNNRDREQEKQKIIKRTQKLDAKLADWDDDDVPSYAAQQQQQQQHDQPKTVILRHMFTLAELDEDPAALLDIKEDVRDECAKLGAVTNVVLYDGEPDGVVSVRFRDARAAAVCVDRMDGRAFDGRTVRAVFASGRERFRRSGKGGEEDDGSDE
jgi:HIV Tat-specific factor 1